MQVVVIDPSPMFCEGMARSLVPGGYAILACASDAATGLPQAHALQPHVIILGPHLYEDRSLALCRELTRQLPLSKVIVITEQADDALFQADAAYSGAAACLPVEVSGQACLCAIEAISAGYVLFPHDILSQAFQPPVLTERERAVLRLLAEGKGNREVAAILKLARSTVRNPSQRILKKLGVHSRAEAVRRARRRGWI